MRFQTETTAMPAALADRATPVRKRSNPVLARLAQWIEAYSRYHGAAAAYEELSRLSDAELARRGLTRDLLHRALREEL
jgi:hypothetical protein